MSSRTASRGEWARQRQLRAQQRPPGGGRARAADVPRRRNGRIRGGAARGPAPARPAAGRLSGGSHPAAAGGSSQGGRPRPGPGRRCRRGGRHRPPARGQHGGISRGVRRRVAQRDGVGQGSRSRGFASSLDPLGPARGSAANRPVRQPRPGFPKSGTISCRVSPHEQADDAQVSPGRAPGTSEPGTPGAARSEHPERGAGTVLALGLGMLVVLAAVLIMLLAQSAAMAFRAAAAADLAALAAADAARGITPGEPCAVAADVARRNGARVLSCSEGAGKHSAGPHRAGSPDARGRGNRTGQSRAAAVSRACSRRTALVPGPVPAAAGPVPPASARPAAGPRGPAARCASGPSRPGAARR